MRQQSQACQLVDTALLCLSGLMAHSPEEFEHLQVRTHHFDLLRNWSLDQPLREIVLGLDCLKAAGSIQTQAEQNCCIVRNEGLSRNRDTVKYSNGMKFHWQHPMQYISCLNLKKSRRNFHPFGLNETVWCWWTSMPNYRPAHVNSVRMAWYLCATTLKRIA